MKEHQTPHKVFLRSAENGKGRFKDFPSKKSNKITNKSLNAAFTSVSEDSVDLSPISEISDANRNEDVTNFLLEEPSSVTLLPSDMTPKNIAGTTGIGSTNCFSACELDSSKFASVEAEIAVNFLRNVKHEVLNSVNDGPQYRKLMDGIIEYVIHDLHSYTTLPEEKDHLANVISMKNQMLFLCTLVWIIGVSVVLFFTSDVHSPYSGPMPT
ncbi:protein SINE3 [Abrus precatorius]|uniref:Protein SINE3 n=1 Tax=Abrus precatorius TaxID=3816 RepID=A0A8B8K3G8_ABRPR|nr:protein SINE3 [Abrus precatorius]